MVRVKIVRRAGQFLTARRGFLALLTAAFCAFAITQTIGGAAAQGMKQIQLSEKQVLSFIAAQPDMKAMNDKLQKAGDKPDPKLQAELEAIAKKHGFANSAEYDDVANNISLVMSGIDPQSKKFGDPKQAIQREIAEVKNDKKMKAAEKKQILDELNEALKTAEPVKFPENIALVTKHFDKIDAAMK